MRMDNNRPKVTVLTAGGAGVTKPTNASSPSGKWLPPPQSSNSSTQESTNPQPTEAQNTSLESVIAPSLEYEEEDEVTSPENPLPTASSYSDSPLHQPPRRSEDLHTTQLQHDGNDPLAPKPMEILPSGASPSASSTSPHKTSEVVWLLVCFLGIMASFVCYGLLLEYATSGGRKLHELSFLFVTSGLYTLTAAAGRYVRDETPTTIPPARFAVLGLTSMGSTFFSVRSLRCVTCLKLCLYLTCAGRTAFLKTSFLRSQIRYLPHSSTCQELQTRPCHADGCSYGEIMYVLVMQGYFPSPRGLVFQVLNMLLSDCSRSLAQIHQCLSDCCRCGIVHGWRGQKQEGRRRRCR